MFRCIKTGFYAVTPSGLYLYGDAFGISNHPFESSDEPCLPSISLLLRVCSASVEKPRAVHITLDTWAHWFDERSGNVVSPEPDFAAVWEPNSTIIASPGQWTWHGYNGVPA